MKRFLFFSNILMFSFIITASSQSIYSDAFALRKLLNASSKWPDNAEVKKQVADILSHYCDRDDIAELFLTANPFIRDYALSWANQSGAGFVGGLNLTSVMSSAGGINVTNIADGLAKFLVERAKQELSIAFFRKFQETLQSTKYRHLRILFSNTASLLKTIDKDIYKFSAFIQALREAFIKDLNNLFETAPVAIRDGLLNDAFSKASPPYLKELFLYAFQITKGLKNGKHPGEIIENFNIIIPSTNKQGLTDVNAVIQITKLFSSSLRSASGNADQYWVAGDEIRLLLADQNAFRIYMGLVYQKAEGIKFSNSTTFQSQMAMAVNNISPYEDLVRNGIDKFTGIQESIDELKEKMKNEISFSEYYDLFRSVTELLNIDEDIEKLPGLNSLFPAKYKTFVSLAENSNEFFLDINLKKYSSGVLRLVTILDTVLKPAYDKLQNDTLVTYVKFRDALIKYGTFLASVGEAQNSDDVKAAIDAAVLPVGSSSIKRETDFNISLNAFIGPYVGSEYLPKLKENQWSMVTGIAAPVGVAFSWGKKGLNHKSDKNVGGKSISIFIPVIDVGALASFRFSDDSSEVASEVNLANIISPGLYCYYGFGKCPISIGFGGQLGPQLREVTAKDINIDKNYYFRFGLNIVVDIPFFNFYTKNN